MMKKQNSERISMFMPTMTSKSKLLTDDDNSSEASLSAPPPPLSKSKLLTDDDNSFEVSVSVPPPPPPPPETNEYKIATEPFDNEIPRPGWSKHMTNVDGVEVPYYVHLRSGKRVWELSDINIQLNDINDVLIKNDDDIDDIDVSWYNLPYNDIDITPISIARPLPLYISMTVGIYIPDVDSTKSLKCNDYLKYLLSFMLAIISTTGYLLVVLDIVIVDFSSPFMYVANGGLAIAYMYAFIVMWYLQYKRIIPRLLSTIEKQIESMYHYSTDVVGILTKAEAEKVKLVDVAFQKRLTNEQFRAHILILYVTIIVFVSVYNVPRIIDVYNGKEAKDLNGVIDKYLSPRVGPRTYVLLRSLASYYLLSIVFTLLMVMSLLIHIFYQRTLHLLRVAERIYSFNYSQLMIPWIASARNVLLKHYSMVRSLISNSLLIVASSTVFCVGIYTSLLMATNGKTPEMRSFYVPLMSYLCVSLFWGLRTKFLRAIYKHLQSKVEFLLKRGVSNTSKKVIESKVLNNNREIAQQNQFNRNFRHSSLPDGAKVTSFTEMVTTTSKRDDRKVLKKKTSRRRIVSSPVSMDQLEHNIDAFETSEFKNVLIKLGQNKRITFASIKSTITKGASSQMFLRLVKRSVFIACCSLSILPMIIFSIFRRCLNLDHLTQYYFRGDCDQGEYVFHVFFYCLFICIARQAAPLLLNVFVVHRLNLKDWRLYITFIISTVIDILYVTLNAAFSHSNNYLLLPSVGLVVINCYITTSYIARKLSIVHNHVEQQRYVRLIVTAICFYLCLFFVQNALLTSFFISLNSDNERFTVIFFFHPLIVTASVQVTKIIARALLKISFVDSIIIVICVPYSILALAGRMYIAGMSTLKSQTRSVFFVGVLELSNRFSAVYRSYVGWSIVLNSKSRGNERAEKLRVDLVERIHIYIHMMAEQAFLLVAPLLYLAIRAYYNRPLTNASTIIVSIIAQVILEIFFDCIACIMEERHLGRHVVVLWSKIQKHYGFLKPFLASHVLLVSVLSQTLLRLTLES